MLPVTLALATGWALLNRWLRRRAGLAPSRFAGRATVTVEVTIGVALLGLFAASVYFAGTGIRADVGLIGGMLIGAANALMLMTVWAPALVLLELLRRQLRAAALPPPSPVPAG